MSSLAQKYPEGVSPATMIDRVEGLCGTEAVDELDQDFICGLVDLRDSGEVMRLTQAQLERLRRIHDRHFAG